jgi:hypothetical protein
MNIPSPVSPSKSDRREQLRLLCALDRARIRLIIRPVEPPTTLGSEILDKAREALPWLLPMAPAALVGLGRKLLFGARRGGL